MRIHRISQVSVVIPIISCNFKPCRFINMLPRRVFTVFSLCFLLQGVNGGRTQLVLRCHETRVRCGVLLGQEKILYDFLVAPDEAFEVVRTRLMIKFWYTTLVLQNLQTAITHLYTEFLLNHDTRLFETICDNRMQQLHRWHSF